MKKTKIILTSFLTLLLFSNCSKQPDCSDDESVQLAKELIIQEMNESTGKAMSIFGVNIESHIKDFVEKNVEITSIRVTSKEKELKKCDCATQISFNFTDEMMDNLEKISTNKNTFVLQRFKDLFSNKIQYEYSLQFSENTEEELFIEGIVPTEELQEIFMSYTMFKKAIVDYEKKEENIEKEKSVQANIEEQELMMLNENDIELAKKWIDLLIKKSNEDLKFEETIYTNKYKDYLKDASAYIWAGDSDLTEEEVKIKWKDDYEISKTDNFSLCGNGSTGEIIPQTKFLNFINKKAIIFETTLTDNGSKETCKKEIKVVKINNSFFIDRVNSK